jgi:hypothetical protein
MKGYQSRTNIVKDEKRDLFTDSHSILARRRIYFSQLFDVQGVSDVGQREIHTTETPVCLSRGPLKLRWVLKS